MKEEWKVVSDFPNYEVSNLGNVRNRKTGVTRKLVTHPLGYTQLTLRKDGKQHCAKVHRLVAMAFIGHAPKHLPEINHINGDKSDNRANNLEWSNRSLNVKHAWGHGLIPSIKGSRNPGATIDEQTAIRIIELRRDGIKGVAIAEMFHVSPSLVYKIANGRAWAHLQEGHHASR